MPADAGTALGASLLNTVTASDSCEGDITSGVVISIAYPSGPAGTAWPAGSMFPVGTSTITWSITDAIGQTVTATRQVTVLNYQLLDAAITFNGAFRGDCTRQVRLTYGGVTNVLSVPLTNGVGAITDLQVPIAAAYPCVTAKDPLHSVTDAASTTVVARQYAVSFTLRQGDATNDDVIDIFDYAAFVTSRGTGKAPDAQAARAMLQALSARAHQVMTGVVLITAGGESEALCVAEVRFNPIDDPLMDWYLAQGEWQGRAGAYAIQRAWMEIKYAEGRRKIGLMVALEPHGPPRLHQAPGQFHGAADLGAPVDHIAAQHEPIAGGQLGHQPFQGVGAAVDVPDHPVVAGT
jgi:predicted house-cleaning NTP pyrophosphatase (Maf/HAM1 superfamily)